MLQFLILRLSEDAIQVSTEEISLLSSHVTTNKYDVSPSSTTTQTVEAGENGERLWWQLVYQGNPYKEIYTTRVNQAGAPRQMG